MAHGFHAAGQYQAGAAAGNLLGGAIDGLQSGGTVALYGPGRDLVATAETQGGDPADVGLVRTGVDTTKDDLVELGGCKRLAGQQWPSGSDGEISGGKQAGLRACRAP
jgi:hypothetical protein